ncbi:threonine--tRNA ligase [Candidatus Daviesbacteria bacterium RIFCSPHIGHO2_01_FULL_40_11]|uniref:Threonine--tRNA ligase n=1 Tax=Candidatus Daviesbacteria bacterium RIFCSPHIGHO2_01_FULL_40_11 TaxID=1797762 RepID=A0A1F5JJJ4_9BACT|nr:MAG: threonine--tRNA ligase [Candidatus Daviesbacteria bacterium RIFCSPHIGHO2_01_FULL_40_11]OGE62771.1 MAG: threonine--tRNA ligase [Candidatus Daviesbacteria bacterium RIFCSPLOWO2_01_FULL_40_27]
MDNKNLKDHKQIGQELELFFTHDIAPGAPFWLPKGMVIFKELEKYIRELTLNAGYLETSTPIMVKSDIFKESGHWEKFGEHNMYNLKLSDEADDSKPISYTLKPMNCPESTIIYRFRPRSYRELPLRLSEIGRLHRREKSGEVNGLLRVRQLTMDDAHIYATEDQIFEEVSNILDMMIEFYKSFGFDYEFRLATRPDTRAGTDENWDKAEQALERVIKEKGIQSSDKKGDGAFYGPKIDVHIKDSQGRDWQLATVQLDFHQPEAFKLEYVDEKGNKQRPVMIHRAIFGSFERFIAILTEHFQGAFPTWLSPVQVQIIPIADRHQGYAQKVLEQLKSSNIRTEVDARAETMQAKIRDAQTQKIPYMVIIGNREEKENKIAVRTRTGQDLGAIPVEEFLEKIKPEVESKA